MPSSTSNSESPPRWPGEYWRRPIPDAHWRAVGLLTALLIVGLFGAWEVYWRTEDYGPSFENTKDLWSLQRAKVGTHGKAETVFIGSSRTAFDLDLDMWQQAVPGPRPLALALVGTSPLPVLHDLAEDPKFTGTLLCGVTEALFFLPAPAPPAVEAAGFVQPARSWSPTARASFDLSVPLDLAYASLNKEDLSLAALLRRRAAANAPSPTGPASRPPGRGRCRRGVRL